MQKLPQFNARELCKAVVKLGFEDVHGSNHQHQYRHPSLTCTARRPFLLFPDSIGKDKKFQAAIIRDISKYWGIPIEDIIKSLK